MDTSWEVQTMHDDRKLSADTTIHLMGSVSYSISSRDLCFFVTLPGSLRGREIGPAPRYGLPSSPKEEGSIPLPWLIKCHHNYLVAGNSSGIFWRWRWVTLKGLSVDFCFSLLFSETCLNLLQSWGRVTLQLFVLFPVPLLKTQPPFLCCSFSVFGWGGVGISFSLCIWVPTQTGVSNPIGVYSIFQFSANHRFH